MEKTNVAFVSGFDGKLPPEAAAAGLTHRFAVIQDTYRVDCVDMFFDVPLYLATLKFAEQFEAEANVSVREWIPDVQGFQEFSLDEYRKTRAPKSREDEPGVQTLVRRGREVRMWIETELWKSVGGPMPYHDSYTYAVYTSYPIEDRLREFLAKCEDSSGWSLAASVILRPAEPPPSFWRRLFRKQRHA